MKTLTILSLQKNIYTASYNGEEANNIHAKSIEDALKHSLAIWGADKYDVIIDFSHNDFDVQYNTDLNGNELVFNSGRVARTQFEIKDNVLDANNKDTYQVRYDEFDDDLTDEENSLVDEYVIAFEFATNH